MLNPTTLQTRLQGLLGYRQPFNTDYAVLDAANLASRSGYFINDNPYVKIETIKDSQDYKDISDANFNTFLRNKVATSIVNVANAVFNQNDVIDRQMLYIHAANKVTSYALIPGFVHYRIQPSIEKNVAFNISRVLLEFKGAGDITICLFNTADMKTPLQTKTVTVNAPFMEVALDWTCDNSTLGKGYKGEYYLGYFTKNLTIEPFKREYEAANIMSVIDNLCITRGIFPDFVDLTVDCDLTKINAAYPIYNGINPDITVYEDFTDLVLQNEKLFARAIMLDCQIALLSECIASIRSNRNERVGTLNVAQLMMQIEGESSEGSVKVTGLRNQFFGALKTIRKEVGKLQTGYQGQRQIMVETQT